MCIDIYIHIYRVILHYNNGKYLHLLLRRNEVYDDNYDGDDDDDDDEEEGRKWVYSLDCFKWSVSVPRKSVINGKKKDGHIQCMEEHRIYRQMKWKKKIAI